jgi:hypothetical protein
MAACLPKLIEGTSESSRNGPVILIDEPVILTYEKPCERVIFSSTRDANPFFHLMEALWMLAGREDVEFPTRFNSKFSQFSDNGVIFNGAYGFRWRTYFDVDQIELAVKELMGNPGSRRVVIGMWDPMYDLGSTSKDIPCNTHIYLSIRENSGLLDMTVCNRSNDAVWGAFGANAVHMSILQEYLAAAIGVKVGLYRQITNNLHFYSDTFSAEKLSRIAAECASDTAYSLGHIRPYPLISISPECWMTELRAFLANPSTRPEHYHDGFFAKVAAPMFAAWEERKANGNTPKMNRLIEGIAAYDWRVACQEWVIRRSKKDV